MRFSILVPVYNVENYIEELFESIDAQQYKDFELIMIDDGSSDNSPNLCDRYCEMHENAYVTHKANAGRMLARLDALKQAKGDYIIFLDSDDKLKECALSDISAVIDETGSDIVIYNAETFDDNNRGIFFEHVLPEGETQDKHIIYDKLFLSYCLNSMCLKAVNRALFDMDFDYSPYYNCTVAEDLLQSVPLYVKADKIYYLDKCLYEYRINSGSTHRYNPSYYDNNKQVSLQIRRELKDEGIADLKQKVGFHLLVAAYASVTQLQYCDSFDKDALEKIRTDEEFAEAWDNVWHGYYKNLLSSKQKMILRLLHGKHYFMIKNLLKLKR